MKVKRFNNLWAMGLILCGAFLIAFCLIKIIYPEFIIGIAETPQIVEIGLAIQSNKWYLHLFNFVVGCTYGYIFFGACCRTYKLNLKTFLILIISNIILELTMEFYYEYYNALNYVNLVFTPFLMCFVNKNLTKETFTSTILCFTLDMLFQAFSMIVRNLTVLTTQGNVVTFLVLLIDGLIWRIIMYLFFNYKNKDKEIN